MCPDFQKEQKTAAAGFPEPDATVTRRGDAEDDMEVAALTGLTQWINCQGDSGETAALMDRLEAELPGKVERGGKPS
ncbi:hypothetical protein D3C76_1742430 [compost metagenome]